MGGDIIILGGSMNLILATLALLACPVLQDQDVIRLKDGTTRRGRIASETNQEVVLETLIKGSKGEVIGSGKVVLLKSEIESIERASEEVRRKTEERAKTFGERGVRRAEALNRIRPEPVQVDGAAGLRVTGTFFILDSTCEMTFVKDMAYILEGIFGAYEKHMGVRRNAGRKVKVYILAGRDEYMRFQTRNYGGAALNPAHYNLKDNFIAAFNMIQKEEERRVLGEIRRVEGLIETLKANVASESDRINRLAREIKQKVADTAAEARRAIRNANPPDAGERLRKVDQWEKENREAVKNQEAELQKELDDIRKAAREKIEANRKILEQNEWVLVNQNRAMLEILFHEGFHAYAANFLWEAREGVGAPRWLHEGMASYFERSAVEGGELVYGALHPAFSKILKEKLPRAGLPRLEDILKSKPEMFIVTENSKEQVEQSTVNYAFCWLLGHTLAERMTAERTQAYVGEILGGADPVKAFEKLSGKSLRDVETELRTRILGFK
jgi:hypothetical protein